MARLRNNDGETSALHDLTLTLGMTHDLDFQSTAERKSAENYNK